MASALALTQDHAAALRLAGQRLDRPAPAGSLVDTCGAIGGAQAQVGSAARLALAARVAGLTAAAYEKALGEERTLVKTWTVRGTLHVVPSRDLPLYVAAFGPLRVANFERWLGRAGVDPKFSAVLTDEIVEALADGPLTRREIAAKVAPHHGPKAKQWIEHSWGGVLHRGVYEGRLCFGPARATEVRFVRTDRWLSTSHLAPVTAADAEAALARRYVRAYGPTTARDFGFWAGIYVPDALRLWSRIADELVPVTVDGRACELHADDLPAARRLARSRGVATDLAAPHVRMLVHFDPYLLGHRDKAWLLDRKRYKRVFRTAGWIAPVLLVDGRIAGTWEPSRKKDTLAARVKPFGRTAPGVRPAARAALAPLAACEGLATKVTWT